MFKGCESLTSIDLSTWDTSNIKESNFLFWECSNLSTLDISDWNMNNVTAADDMFSGCCSLKTIYCESDWTINEIIINANWMFDGCYLLVGSVPFDSSKISGAMANKEGYFTVKT